MMKILLVQFFILFSVLLSAQKVPVWVFSIGFESQSLGIEPLDSREPDKASVLSGRPSPGISVGMAYKHLIWRSVYLQPGISFSSTRNKVSFRQDGEAVYGFHELEAPLHLAIYNSTSTNARIRAKVLIGGRFGWNFASNPDDRLSFYNNRFGLDLGLGMEIQAGRLLLSPEVLYSHGMNNLHNFTGKKYDYLVGRVVRDKVSFRLAISFNRKKNEHNSPISQEKW
ncbi:MAG: outer membrane beta-barrel protein [Saprospiraceae bacterium]|nr:outer membrane beta-barrel protein [Saprospiraceae bacterium]